MLVMSQLTWSGNIIHNMRAVRKVTGHMFGRGAVYRLVGSISFRVVPLLLYTRISAFLPVKEAPLVAIFFNISHLSRHLDLNLLNFIESVTFIVL